MVGNIPRLTLPTSGATTLAGEVLYVPLEFWFNRNAGLALPLIALQYHEVKVNLEFRDKADCFYSSDTAQVVPDFDECSLFVDYIYLNPGLKSSPVSAPAQLLVKVRYKRLSDTFKLLESPQSHIALINGYMNYMDNQQPKSIKT